MKPLGESEVILQVEELKVHFALSKTFFSLSISEQ